jgi:hypothetical protein
VRERGVLVEGKGASSRIRNAEGYSDIRSLLDSSALPLSLSPSHSLYQENRCFLLLSRASIREYLSILMKPFFKKRALSLGSAKLSLTPSVAFILYMLALASIDTQPIFRKIYLFEINYALLQTTPTLWDLLLELFMKI